MQTHNLIAGTPEWHAHRATHFNASDAPAMLGCSPYTTRAELLLRLHTGIAADVDTGTQRLFDNGHRFEALARPLAEKIIGDDLAPVIGTAGELSASFDGLTLMGDTAWEHKTLNDELRGCMKDQGNGLGLPKHYQVQMEQQLLVSGAERVLFMATKWAPEGSDWTLVEGRHCWYASDPALRAEIIAGWKQFAQDLSTYTPPAASAVEKIIAEPVESLPAPVVQVSGQLTLQDNFTVFEERLRLFLAEKLIREPKSDEDFVNLDAQIKAMKQGRESLKAAKAQMLGQVQPIDQASKTADMLDKMLQQACSMAEALLKDEKERRRGEIVAGGVKALADHIAALNKRIGHAYMPAVPADFGGAVRGLKSLASMEDKVSGELARAKIAASAIADGIDANLKALPALLGERTGLTPDLAVIVLKSADDFAAVVSQRVTVQRDAEERRAAELAEKAREKIRAEEAAKLKAEQDAKDKELARIAALAAEAAKPASTTAPAVIVAPAVSSQAPAVVPIRPTAAPAASTPTLRLGQINERLAPLSIDAAGLATLGFPHSATDKAAKLWHEWQFEPICEALERHVGNARERFVKQAAA